MTAPSPDAPGQGEAGVGGEVDLSTRVVRAMQVGGLPWLEAERLLAAHDASVVAAARADTEGRLGEALAVAWDDGYAARSAEIWDTKWPVPTPNPHRVLDAAGPREGEL